LNGAVGATAVIAVEANPISKVGEAASPNLRGKNGNTNPDNGLVQRDHGTSNLIPGLKSAPIIET